MSPSGLVVLGCHRSGTSAATAAIAALGLSPGHGRMITGEGNAEGHHEPYYLAALNDEVLRRMGGSWVGPPPLGPAWVADARLDPVRHRARVAFAETFDRTGWVWKDPRCCLTLPFWEQETGIVPAVVLMLRDPMEVARSLVARDGLSEAAGVALWERSVRGALAAAAGRPTFVTTYDDLLADPVTWAERVRDLLEAAGLPEPTSRLAAAAAVVRAGLRHHTEVDPASAWGAPAEALAATVRTVSGVHKSFVVPSLEDQQPWIELVLAEAGRAHVQRQAHQRALAELRPALQPMLNLTRVKVTAHRLLHRSRPRPVGVEPPIAAPALAVPVDEVERFVLFVGYPRSGHSLVGSLLDAHPEVVIAHELDALADVAAGASRVELYRQLLVHDRDFTEAGRAWMGYDYDVPGGWQGRTRRLRVIGDKKGGSTTERLGHDPALLDRVRALTGVPLVLVHVTRNPFDNIATIAARSGAPLDACVARYTDLVAINERVRLSCAGDPEVTWVDVAHEALIADPKHELERLATTMGVDAEPSWLESCQPVVFPSPRRTRDGEDWTPDAITAVRRCIEVHEPFGPYRDEAGPGLAPA